MVKLGRLIMVASSLLVGACASQGETLKSAPIALGDSAPPPHGFVEFCQRQPGDCAAPEKTKKKPIALSKARWFELETVNAMVNHLIVAKTDLDLYSRNEYWTLPVDAGDCEDFALLKRRQLVERGWPAQALLLSVGYDVDGRAHAVLMVATDKGDYVLDNLTDEILPWWETPYDWSIRQSGRDPQEWVQLRPASPSEDVASTRPRQRRNIRSPVIDTHD